MTAPGNYALVARAHSESGRTQPFDYDPDNLGYLINTVRPVEVTVEAGAAAADFADRGAWIDYLEAYAQENTRRPLDVELALTGGDGI